MDLTLLILGIQAMLRAVQAGAKLYEEHARDRPVFLPGLELPGETREDQLRHSLKENPDLVKSHPELLDIWDFEYQELKTSQPELVDAAFAIVLQYEAKRQSSSVGGDEAETKRDAQMLAAGRMVEQWREERKPPSALIRMALTLTDIGLEFVVADPSILGVGSRGEKLIVAFAKNMSALIPDDATAFGSKTDFADRVLGIFLRAGLGTLANNVSVVFKDEDVARLMEGVTKPIVEALPTSIADQIHYRDLVDALAGPAAETAFKLLAENTDTYLGRDFADDRALGAVTSALFGELTATAHDASMVDVFSEQGVIRLYQAGLTVAIDRPGLFAGDDDSAMTELFRELLRGTANTLHAHPRFKGPVGASLAAMVVKAVGNNAPALLKLNPNEPWEKVAVTVFEQLTAGLTDALKKLDADGSLKGALKSFNNGQLLELGRVVLARVARTPGVLGIHRSEVQSIVAGMAEVMAADDNLLLSADEWIKIAGVAAQKAASNPGRLFGMSATDHGGALAVEVIQSVLRVAGNIWNEAGRSEHSLLFGETLEAVIEAVIEALAGNVAAIANQPDLVEQFLQKLLKKASENPAKFGSEGLLKVFRKFVGDVLARGALFTDQEIDQALSA